MNTAGRRVGSLAEVTQPGDYWYDPTGSYAGGTPTVMFLLPNAHKKDAPSDQRRIHHVVSPPHVFRECAAGSIEIRQSIGAQPYWHGFLDEGHIWRGDEAFD